MAFVHPAAVVPWLRLRRLDGVALVAGTVGADFEYFCTLSAKQHLHPDPLWTLAAGVVVGALLLALVSAVGVGIAEALPAFFSDRCGAALVRPLRDRGAVMSAVSVGIGALMHVAWDAVGEHNGALHAVVPWRAVATWSTPVGVAVLVAALALAPRGKAPVPFRMARLAALVAGALVGAALLAAVRAQILGGSFRDVTAAGSAGAILGVAVAALRRSAPAAADGEQTGQPDEGKARAV